MKTVTRSLLLFFILFGTNYAHSQTTIYADTLLAVSNEFNISNLNCTGAWSACKILGVPDVYPGCGDTPGAWTFTCTHNREWIEVGYSTQMYVDTIRIYETYTSGALDTIYLRDASTGLWNTVFSDTTTVTGFAVCNVKEISMPTTSYKVDGVRLAIGDYTGYCYPEYDAIALIGTAVSTGIEESKMNSITVFPNPSNGDITISTSGSGNTNFIIYDVIGNIVFNKILTQQTETVSLNLPLGIYFSCSEKNGNRKTEKLIVH